MKDVARNRTNMLNDTPVIPAFLLGALLHASSVSAQAPSTFAGRPPSVQGFSVVLVLADRATATAAATEPMPVEAARAIDDVKGLLPFKSYRLMDAQWTTGSNHAPVRLHGPDGLMYRLLLKANLLVPGRIAVSQFRLWELSKQAAQSVPPAQTRGAAAGAGSEGDAPQEAVLIDTTFGMAVGETLVVGTSALQDTRALVILLTAKGR